MAQMDTSGQNIQNSYRRVGEKLDLSRMFVRVCLVVLGFTTWLVIDGIANEDHKYMCNVYVKLFYMYEIIQVHCNCHRHV